MSVQLEVELEMASRLGPYELNTIVTGDARELAKAIPDESVDLILTDPPYPKEYLPLFEWLGHESSRMLKSDGFLITLTGQNYFDVVFASLSRHLYFYWIGAMKHHEGMAYRFHPKHIMSSWKPTLWFTKSTPRSHPYVFDLIYNPRDKRFHKWGQGTAWFSYYISKLTTVESVLFDPFCGGGTVPTVCKMLGRNYLAFEIDPATAELARERVRLTQPPLFVPETEQLSFTDDI